MGLLVGPAAALPPIVGKSGLDLYLLRLEGGQDITGHFPILRGAMVWLERFKRPAFA